MSTDTMGTLNDLPTVLFVNKDLSKTTVPPARAKFMLIKVAFGEEEKLILRTAPGFLGHQNIVEWVGRELVDRLVTGCTIGQQKGGWLVTDVIAKKMAIGGRSFQFGPADHAKAQELLKAALPGYEILIDPLLK